MKYQEYLNYENIKKTSNFDPMERAIENNKRQREIDSYKIRDLAFISEGVVLNIKSTLMIIQREAGNLLRFSGIEFDA